MHLKSDREPPHITDGRDAHGDNSDGDDPDGGDDDAEDCRDEYPESCPALL